MHIGPCSHKSLYSCKLTIFACGDQSCASTVVSVDFGTMLDEESDDLNVAVDCRADEGGVLGGPSVRIRASLQQVQDRFSAVFGAEKNSRVAVLSWPLPVYSAGST